MTLLSGTRMSAGLQAAHRETLVHHYAPTGQDRLHPRLGFRSEPAEAKVENVAKRGALLAD